MPQQINISPNKQINSLKLSYLPAAIYIVLTAVLSLFLELPIESIILKTGIRLLFLAILYLILFQSKINIPQLLKYLIPLVFLAFFYNETASFNQFFYPVKDQQIYNLDYDLFGFQPSVEFSKQFAFDWFKEVMSFSYIMFYPFILGIAVFLYKQNLAYFKSFMFVVQGAFYIYFIIFIFYPVIGPQYFLNQPDNYYEASGLFSKILKTIQFYGEVPTAAFPSSHVGISALVLFYAYKLKGIIKIFSTILFITLSLSTVYIKAHYAIDVFAGIISSFVIAFPLYLLFNKLTPNK